MSGAGGKRIFIAPLDWGLGHATRTLPLIKKILSKGHVVYIAASGRSRMLLESEVSGCQYINFPRYPIRYPKSRFFVTRFMLTTFPVMLLTMIREYSRLKKLHESYHFDLIISDNRFCTRHIEVPSFLISHQLRYKLPWPVRKMEWLPEYFNARLFNKYDHIIIPDIEDPNSYTGELSHNMRYLDQKKLYYAGIISSLQSQMASEKDIQLNQSETSMSLRGAQRKSNLTNNRFLVPENNSGTRISEPPPKLDYLVIISGPEPQRTKFENIIRGQISQITGTVAVAMGLPEKNYKISIGDKKFYTYLSRVEMAVFMNNSDFIIARPGYTTVMEMIELGKRGLFIPTPGQVEQEYLARYYQAQNWCHMVPQHKLDLVNDVAIAKEYPGFPASPTTVRQNVEQLYKELFNK